MVQSLGPARSPPRFGYQIPPRSMCEDAATENGSRWDPGYPSQASGEETTTGGQFPKTPAQLDSTCWGRMSERAPRRMPGILGP